MKMSELMIFIFAFGLLACLVFFVSACSDIKSVPAEETSEAPEASETPGTRETPEITDIPETAVTPHKITEDSPEDTAAIPPDDALVRIRDHIPDIIIDLKYATSDNFTGQVIYDFKDAYARYGTVVKLAKAQEILRKQGYCIKIWDAFRPAASQRKLWEVFPDADYVSDPDKGYSNHTRGSAVDITLTDMNGNEIEMPTGFDCFTDAADRDYSDADENAASNARLLEDVMESCGFNGYFAEWWHYNDSERYYPDTEFYPKK